MQGILRVLSDKQIRHLLYWLVPIALGLMAPYLFEGGWKIKTLFLYLKEIGFAIMVAIPLLLSIERFNQRRHEQAEKTLLTEQAIALVKKGVPDVIWEHIDHSLIEAPFFREDYIVTYTLTHNDDDPNNEFVEVQIHIKYRVKRMRATSELASVPASIALTEDNRALTKFISFKVGTEKYDEEKLKNLVSRTDDTLIVDKIPAQHVNGSGLKVDIEVETAFPLKNAFEAFVVSCPATKLDIIVNASSTLKVMLDTLHDKDMVKVESDCPRTYHWIQNSGLITGQGAIIRWEKR